MFPILRFGTLQLPTFYLVISLGLTFLILHFSFRIDKKNQDTFYQRKQGFDLLLLILVFGFIGARGFHILYEEPHYYRNYPLEIFKFWNGGFVFYGGFILSFLATLIYCHLKEISFYKWADFFTPYLSVGYAIGRIGCFLEGCCYGQYCDLPWSLKQRHPTQLYMFFAELILFI